MASRLPADIRAHILSHGQILHDAIELIRPAPAHWHTTLLIELATVEYANCLELIDGVDKVNLAKTAWAARNMLELHYFVRYVSTSPENARRYAEDVICDYQSLSNELGKNPQYSQFLAQGQPTIDQLWQAATEAKKGDPYLSSRKIAKDFGEEIPYAEANKLFSKFVHPTSLSVQFRKANAEFHNMVIWGIVETAGRLFAATVTGFSQHIREYSKTVLPA
jgi:hypothetical protein